MSTANRSKFVIYRDGNAFHWKLVVRGKVTAHSSQPYPYAFHARRAAEALAHHAATAKIVDE